MKGRRLLAILASFCMLLILMPAFALGGSADVTLPDTTGRTNYATPEQFTLTNAELKDVSETETCIHFNSNGNFSYNAGDVSADLSALSGKDYVEGFSAMLYNWHSAPQLEWTVGSVGGTALKIVLSTSACTYSGPSGAGQTIDFTVAQYATPNYAVYVQNVAGNTVVNLFVNGTLVNTFNETGTVTPAFRVRYGNGYCSYFMDMLSPFAYSASPELPGMPLGAINYAIDAAATTNNAANAYDATNGYINLQSSNWSSAKYTLAPENFSADDDIVISFILKRPYSWGTDSNALITFGSDGVNTQKINFQVGNPNNVPNNATTYTDAAGEDHLMAAAASWTGWTDGVLIGLHLCPDGNGTRTIDVFANGALLASLPEQDILPFVWQVSGYSNTSYTIEFCGLRMYKVRSAAAYEPAAAATQVQTDGITSQYVPLPGMPLGAINYAIGAPSTTSSIANGYDDANGYINMQSSNWGTTSWTLTPENISTNNDVVVSFILKKPYSWGQTYNTEITFGKSGVTTQKINFTINGTTYTDAAGTAHALSAITSSAGWNAVKVDLHMYPDGAGTRTIDVFVNGGLFVSLPEQDILPLAWQVTGNNNTSYSIEFFGLRMYVADPTATEFEPDATATQVQTDGLTTQYIYYTVTVPTVAGGSVTGAGRYVAGASVTLTATPDASHLFSGWMVNDAIVSTNKSYSFTIEDDITVTPVYRDVIAIPTEPQGDDPMIVGADLSTSDEEKASWNDGTWAFTSRYSDYPIVSAQAETDEDFVGLDILDDSSYVVRFNANALSYGNGWGGWVYFGKIGSTKLCFKLSSANFTYDGFGGYQEVVSGTFYNSQTIAIYVRREANGKTGIYMNNNGVQLFQIQEDYAVEPILEFSGYNGQGFTWNISNVQAFAAADGPNASTPVYVRGVKIVDAQSSYTISGIIGGTQNVAAHSWSTRSYEIADGSTLTITAAETDNPATIMVVKDTNQGYGVISNGNVFTTTIDGDLSLAIQAFARPNLTIVAENGTVSGLTAGYQIPQDEFTATATPDEGYVFDHWEFSWLTENDEPISFTENPVSLALAATGDITATAVFVMDAPSTFSVTAGTIVGGTVTGLGDGYDYGDTVIIAAIPDPGYSFRYMVINGRAYTRGSVIVPVTDNITVDAYFNEIMNDSYTVSFFTCDKRFITSIAADELDFDNLPPVPPRYGYTANGWDYVWEDGIYSDISVYPVYIKDVATTYSIAVSGGTVNRNYVPFETKVTVTADDPEGFVCWKDEAGNVISTRATYSFFVTADVTLIAYSEGTAPSYIVMVNSTSLNTVTDETHFRCSIIGETFAADGYTILERGIVYKTDNADDLEIGNAGVRKKACTTLANNQFMYTLNNCPVNTNIFAKAYMIVKDSLGTLSTVYSDVACDCSCMI